MAMDGLWSLGGLQCEDWLISWWDCHLFCHEYKGWYDIMRVDLCLMRSLPILLWEDHLWDYYRAFGVGFGAWFQRVDVVISDEHRSLVLIIWGFKSTMFETVVVGWVAFISISSHPIIFINIWIVASPLSLTWAS